VSEDIILVSSATADRLWSLSRNKGTIQNYLKTAEPLPEVRRGEAPDPLGAMPGLLQKKAQSWTRKHPAAKNKTSTKPDIHFGTYHALLRRNGGVFYSTKAKLEYYWLSDV